MRGEKGTEETLIYLSGHTTLGSEVKEKSTMEVWQTKKGKTKTVVTLPSDTWNQILGKRRKNRSYGKKEFGEKGHRDLTIKRSENGKSGGSELEGGNGGWRGDVGLDSPG